MKRYADRDAIEALAINERDTLDRERQFAREEFALGRSVYYCRGEGHPVAVLRSLDEWEQRDKPAPRRAN